MEAQLLKIIQETAASIPNVEGSDALVCIIVTAVALLERADPVKLQEVLHDITPAVH